MQKVKFEAATGAELRQQMMDFLGLNGGQTISTVIKGSDISLLLDRSAESRIADDKVENTQETIQVTPETSTKKRRTKAEIEAEKNAAANQNQEDQSDQPAVETETIVDVVAENVAETPKVEGKKSEGNSEITRPFLTEIVLAKGREGKKPAMLKLFAGFVQADGTTAVTGLPTLDAKDYEAFYEQVKDL